MRIVGSEQVVRARCRPARREAAAVGLTDCGRQTILMATATARELPRHWKAIRQEWTGLTVHQRFEAAVTYLLTFVIAAVILVAFGRLVVSVVDTVVLKSLNPLEHAVFQRVFGEIMTLLIAMEFNHTV